ncbi:MAG: TnpV protein [Clostridiales bacterium]|nr:MAG: TnpV protein [Clostridiales bacterium]
MKTYLEEHNVGKLWSLAGNLPEYLHGIDKAAEELYETMYAKLSKDERFKKTDDFLDNLRKETEMQSLIEEEILKRDCIRGLTESVMKILQITGKSCINCWKGHCRRCAYYRTRHNECNRCVNMCHHISKLIRKQYGKKRNNAT